MSREQLEAAVSRAINDSAFRDLLASDLDAALADYDLSEDERALLANAQGKGLNELLSLDSRDTKGGGGWAR